MRRTPRRRPLLRSLADGLVFLALLAMVVLALRQSGLLAPATGEYVAIDGDSLRKGGAEFRLDGIDAPELHQTCRDEEDRDYPCGREARTALRELIAGQQLSCVTHDTDRYGRGVVTCRAGSRDINGEMVRLGWAVAYRRHNLTYLAAEDQARRARRGIWRGRFETPQTWRARHRNALQRGGMAAGEEIDD